MKKELLAAAAALLVVSSAAAQSGPPGMPALTRPVGQTQELDRATVQKGGALALGSGPSTAAPKRAETQMVDTAKKVPEVPRALASAALPSHGADLDTNIGAAEDLVGDVAMQRSSLSTGSPSLGPLRPTPSEITVKPGRNEMIQVGRGHLNRLVTPFGAPDVKTAADKTRTTFEVEGSIVYVATTETQPIGFIITDLANPANAMTVTLLPRDVPAVSVALRMDEVAAPLASGGLGVGGGQDDFVASLRETFRQLALGEVPAGFGMKRTAAGNPLMPECLMPGLSVQPAQEITGSAITILVAKLTNRNRIPLSVDEMSCASDRVLAVAAWPSVELMPGQSTELYIALRREAPPSINARPSVLN